MTRGHSHPQRHPDTEWIARCEHVFITHIGSTPIPGLLCAWRRHPVRTLEWQGWVIFAELDATGEPYVRQSWVEAGGIQRLGD